jgi:hypothetical protein
MLALLDLNKENPSQANSDVMPMYRSKFLSPHFGFPILLLHELLQGQP